MCMARGCHNEGVHLVLGPHRRGPDVPRNASRPCAATARRREGPRGSMESSPLVWRSPMAEEAGARVAAGPLTFVVEHRTVVQDGVEAGGPTVRVLGAADEHEYLRFDMFNMNPHYHYEPPAEKERI